MTTTAQFTYGPWVFDPKTMILEAERYPIDLTRFTSSAEMLDMIMQIEAKTWATDDHVAWLVRALNDLLVPQANLCSQGQNLTWSHDDIVSCASDRFGERTGWGAE